MQKKKSPSGSKTGSVKQKSKKSKKERKGSLKKEFIYQIGQSTINKLILLAVRPKESWGVIDEDGNILDLRYGDEWSVQNEILPERGIAEFHIHPISETPKVVIPNQPKLSKAETKCATEEELLGYISPSSPDVFGTIRFLYRINMPSLIVVGNHIIQYVLTDKVKYEIFKGVVKSAKGDDTESMMGAYLDDQYTRIKNEIQNKILDEEQNFSRCGQRDVKLKAIEEWKKYLEVMVGVSILYREIKYKKM